MLKVAPNNILKPCWLLGVRMRPLFPFVRCLVNKARTGMGNLIPFHYQKGRWVWRHLAPGTWHLEHGSPWYADGKQKHRDLLSWNMILLVRFLHIKYLEGNTLFDNVKTLFRFFVFKLVYIYANCFMVRRYN
jgi:hypothetical protein